MTIYKKDTIIATYPAYNIVSRDKDSIHRINISAGDTLYNDNIVYEVSSVVSYALNNNLDPIELYNRAVLHGQKTHFIIALGSSITNTKKEKKTHLQVDFDAIYRFEGKLFKIINTANNNLAFKSVD